jgi:hypothetical protein
MTTLVINGQKVKVSDDFLKLSPEQQNSTVDEIARSMGAVPAAPVAAQSPAMAAGLTDLSGMTQNPAVAMPERGMGQKWYDNLVGDPNDGVESYGEQIGRSLNDMGSAAGAGFARGTASLAGIRGTVADMNAGALEYLGKATGIAGDDFSLPRSGVSGAALTSGMGNVTGGATDYRGKTTAGQFAGTVGEFLPGAMIAPGGMASNALRYGVIPGISSEAAGQLTEGTAIEPYARVAGALAGGILPDLLKKGATKLISPYGGADPERLKLAKYLEDQGIPLTAGQKVGSEALRRKEGFTAAGQDMMETQAEAFTKAALKTAGTDAKRATPEVLKATAERIGGVFDDVVKGVDVTPDPKAVTALSESVNTYKSLAPTGNQAPLISEVFKETAKAARGGNTIPASTLKVWRSNLSKLTASVDTATRTAAIDALEAVDDMMASALTAAGRVDDIARLDLARTEWRNFLAIQKAASGAGENAAAGLISPSALRNATVTQGRSAYAQGTRGDIADLARAGEGVIKRLPTSGTAENLRAMMPSGIWGGIGAGVGGAATANPLGAMAGAAMGTMIPGLAGAARMSKPMQAYLANQILPKAATNIPKGAALSLLPFLDDMRSTAQ